MLRKTGLVKAVKRPNLTSAVSQKYLSDRTKNYIFMNRVSRVVYRIFLGFFKILIIPTPGRYLQTPALKRDRKKVLYKNIQKFARTLFTSCGSVSCDIIGTQLSECLEKRTPEMLFKSPGKVLENSLNRKLANLYEPWRQNEEPQAGSLHTSKCDDTAKKRQCKLSSRFH